MDFSLDNQHIVIVGGTSGIGLSTARMALARGAEVTVTGRSPERMEAAKQEPKLLDDKDISLADIARLAGIKEYTEAPKVSEKAEKLVESIILQAELLDLKTEYETELSLIHI